MENAEESFLDLEELQFLETQGFDKAGRRILRIVGKYLPAPVVDNVRLKDYIQHKVLKDIPNDQFCIVYFHTRVSRRDNSPGIFNLRWFYESLPMELKQRLGTIYFVHPGLLSRGFLGIFGRFLLSERLFYKLCYISRLEFLWDYIKQGQLEVPDFVFDHDKELEHRPLMDYWVESDPLGAYSLTGGGLRLSKTWAP